MKNFPKALRTTPLLLSVIIIAFAGCKTSGGPANGLSTDNRVVWYIPSDIERMNPFLSTDESANYVQGEIWETLTGTNPRTNADIPLLASLPEVSADHLTYTYTLDPKAHWSDGKPVTVADIIFNFKVVKNPLLINAAAQRSFFSTLDSVWSPDGSSKVMFHWSKFIFNIPNIQGGTKIIPKHIFDPTNITDKITWADLREINPSNPAVSEFQKWFEAEKIGRDSAFLIGSGPYKYQNWITNDRITLKLDTNYWAMDRPWMDAYPNEITFKTIKDLNAALTALKAKDIDIMDGMSATQYLNQLDTSKLPFLKKDTVYVNLYSYIGWNCAKAPFNDKIVRKALTMLIDRDRIIHSLLHDMTRKVEGPVPPTQPNYDPTVKQPEFNPDSAKKLLAADGWADTQGTGVLEKKIGGKQVPFKLTFMIPSGSDVPKQICLIIANELKKVGIQADISQIEWSVYLENLKSHKFDAIMGSWVGSTGVEGEMSQIWESNEADNRGSNYVSFKNPVADTLMEHIKIEADVAKRHEMSHQLQHIIQDEQPYTFMFSSPVRIGWVDRFDNFELFHTRPPFDPRYWIVRGSGVKRLPTGIPMGVNGDKATMP